MLAPDLASGWKMMGGKLVDLLARIP